MDGFEQLGRWMVLAGVGLVVAGGLVWLLGRFKGLQELPGTLRIQLGSVSCIIPLLASVVLSVVLTVVLNLILRGFRR